MATIDEVFQAQKNELQQALQEQLARSRGQQATRLAQIGQLRSPVQEYTFGELERGSQRALGQGLAQLLAQQLQARQRQEQIELQKQQIAQRREAYERALGEQAAGRKRARRGAKIGGLSTLAGAGLGALLAIPTGGLSVPLGAALGGSLGGGFGGIFGGGGGNESGGLSPELLAMFDQQPQQIQEPDYQYNVRQTPRRGLTAGEPGYYGGRY